jgi:hypothetical protein
MNVISNSTPAAFSATHSVATYFTQDSHAAANGPTYAGSNTGRYKTEMSAMSYRKVGSRVPYASALYAAAVAALLSACSPQSKVEPAPEATTIHLSETETASDMPEVVVTASRERPKANG